MGEGRPRRQFTLRDLLVTVAVLCGLLALGSMCVSSFRHHGIDRRARCSNNLRQLGLAVHEYHDVHNELPPLANGDGDWSWVAHLRPYMWEAGYNDPDPRTELAPAAGPGLTRALAWQSSFMFCPTRRNQGRRSAGTFAGGCPTDYAAVSTSTTNQWSSTSDGMLVLCKTPPTKTNAVVSSTTFDDVTDGLSNTALLGEKHMQAAWFGGPLDEPALFAVKGPSTVRLATDLARFHPLAGPDSNDRQAFGSWHPQVTLFCKGDASVVPVNKQAAPRVLRYFTSRNDGQKFQFPDER